MQMNPVYGWEDFGIEPGTIYLINRPAPTPTEVYRGSLFSNILLHFIRKNKNKNKKKTKALYSSSSLDFDSR